MVTTPNMDLAASDEYYYSDDVIPMTPAVQIPSAIGLSLLIFTGIGGNVLTIMSYFKDRHLHNIYDFFILNIALTDLLLCSISMPFYAVYTLMEFTWPFGYSFCKVWLVFDFTLCFESIILMLVVSLDRLLMISLGPVYTQKVTKRVACIEIVVSWIVSFLVYGPSIIGWNYWVGKSTVEYMDCDVEFAYDHKFTTATSVVEFILPFVCLTSLNAIIYYKIRRRVRIAPMRGNLQVQKDDVSRQGPSNDKQTKGGNGRFHEQRGMCCLRMRRNATEDVQPNTSTAESTGIAADKYNLNNTSLTPAAEARGSKPQRHVKAAKFLAVLVAAFLIFWAPYTISTMMISFCHECVNTSLYEFFNWFLWIKSAVNPFLYAFNSPRYRKFMLKYLTVNGKLCKCKVNGQEQPTTMTSVN